MPDNYPGITFNENGICNYCNTYKEAEYLDYKDLKAKIESYRKTKKDINDNYDCVLAFSGGRDSSFLLYYLAKVLNLRVIAYSADNGFIPEQTKLNMKNMCEIVKAKLVIEKHEYLKKCLKYHMSAWMHRPSAAMIGMLCTGCRLGMDVGTFNFARINRIPVVISGGTPFEGQNYKTNLLKTNPNGGTSSLALGYLFQIMGNPKWIMNACSVITQCKEFYYHYYLGRKKFSEKLGLFIVSPYYTHIRWKEDEIIATIKKELNWKEHPGTQSTWRGDCDIALLKLYLYNKTIGVNDKVDGLSSLIRDGQISREEALKRLKKEEEIPEIVIKDIFARLELNYSDLKIALRTSSGDLDENKNS